MIATVIGAAVLGYGLYRIVGGYTRPLPAGSYRITSPVGIRTSPITGQPGTFHDGIDLGAPSGTEVRAVSGGRVVASGWLGSCGYGIVIEDVRYRWSYCHLRAPSPFLAGDEVKQGKKIGEVGTTGSSTAPHLHLGVRSIETGEVLDPKKLGVPL